MDAIRGAGSAARRGASLIALTLIIGGCGSDSSEEPAAATAAATTAAGAALTRADVPSDCRSSVPEGGAAAPASLQGPPGRMSTTTDAGGVVNGFVDKTPGEFLAAWKARSGIEVDGEDEGVEGEVYLTIGDTRISYKLRKVCPTGSVFSAKVE